MKLAATHSWQEQVVTMTDQGEQKKINRRTQGYQTELIAESYFTGQGYHLVRKNFYTYAGEIDLIFLTPDAKTLVFVEVRSSRGSNPLLKYSIGMKKRKHLRASIAIFKRLEFGKTVNLRTLSCRVDMVWVQREAVVHWKNVRI